MTQAVAALDTHLLCLRRSIPETFASHERIPDATDDTVIPFQIQFSLYAAAQRELQRVTVHEAICGCGRAVFVGPVSVRRLPIQCSECRGQGVAQRTPAPAPQPSTPHR
jgi:hypothetical protein